MLAANFQLFSNDGWIFELTGMDSGCWVSIQPNRQWRGSSSLNKPSGSACVDMLAVAYALYPRLSERGSVQPHCIESARGATEEVPRVEITIPRASLWSYAESKRESDDTQRLICAAYPARGQK